MNIGVWFRVALLLGLAGLPSAQALPLWQIEGTQNRIHILGSIHFLRPTDYPLPEPILRAYEDADLIVMEVNLGSLDPVQAQSVMQRLAIDPQGRTLSDALGTTAFGAARRKAAALDIDLATLQAYEPWFAALQITQLRLMQLGFDPGFGIESRLTLRGIQDGKQLAGLETLEMQLSALDSLPAEAQRGFLIQTLDEAAEVETMLDDVVRAWRAGDTAKLERELLASMQDQQALYDAILVQRNRNWAKQIIGFTQDRRDYLIVVGALHLVGEDSVLEMLKAAGYSTRQIKR